MTIAAVSGVSVTTNNRNAIHFGAGKNKRAHGSDNQYGEGAKSNKASGMITIPTALFLALASGSINAQAQNQFNSDFDNSEKIELLAMSNPQSVRGTSSSQQVRRGDLPGIMNTQISKNIYQKDFKMDGKMWTMYFHNADVKGHGPNTVTQIYLIPYDYRQIIGSYDEEVNSPPRVEKFIIHRSKANHDDTFAAVKILEVVCDKDGKNKRRVRREMRLPDELANEIIGVFLGETKYKMCKDLVKNYTIVDTPKMMAPEVISLERDDEY